MDVRLAAAPVVMDLARAPEGVVAGLYVGGSLATGDYRPGLSDIDAATLRTSTGSTGPGPSRNSSVVR